MKMIFTTENRELPSTILNRDLLRQINNLENAHIDFYKSNWHDYDVILFMGYDHKIHKARIQNKEIKIGVIDPRPSLKYQPVGADFILANGIEMLDWYLKYTSNIFKYYIYPILKTKRREHYDKKRIVIGYHGNKIHLSIMYPRITKAIELLADERPVELWAMYNIKKLGKWNYGLPHEGKLKIRHIQWSHENYEKYLSGVDIGIVPNLLPIDDGILRSFSSDKDPHFFNMHNSDYLTRCKATSNPGRIFVFAQYGIPVVADMFPSALQVIENEVNGYVCFSTEAWYWALKNLSDNSGLRTEMAESMQHWFERKASPGVMNRNLIDFINKTKIS